MTNSEPEIIGSRPHVEEGGKGWGGGEFTPKMMWTEMSLDRETYYQLDGRTGRSVKTKSSNPDLANQLFKT